MGMAVGLIVGSAFTAIVTSLNQDIITPLLGLILGQIDFTSLSLTVGGASVMYGNFIQAIITFLITALTLFFVLKGFNKMTRKKEEREGRARSRAFRGREAAHRDPRPVKEGSIKSFMIKTCASCAQVFCIPEAIRLSSFFGIFFRIFFANFV